MGEMEVETNRFVLEMERILDGLNTRRIAELREKLKRDRVLGGILTRAILGPWLRN